MIRISVNTRHAYKVYTEMITSGSSGIPVKFNFSDDWDGLNKVATFSGSGVIRDMVLTEDTVTVPYDVLTQAGGDLLIGVYGTDGDDGKVIIPTIWANVGRIRQGVVPKCETDPQPTATVIDQLLTAVAESESVSQQLYDHALAIVEGQVFIFFEIHDDGYLYLVSSDNFTEEVVTADINSNGELEIYLK